MKLPEGVRAVAAKTAADDDITWTEDEAGDEDDDSFDSFAEDDLVRHSTPLHLATPKVVGPPSGVKSRLS